MKTPVLLTSETSDVRLRPMTHPNFSMNKTRSPTLMSCCSKSEHFWVRSVFSRTRAELSSATFALRYLSWLVCSSASFTFCLRLCSSSCSTTHLTAQQHTWLLNNTLDCSTAHQIHCSTTHLTAQQHQTHCSTTHMTVQQHTRLTVQQHT